ncbi:unnamed protein product [Closterium sp. NIES-53]
MYGGWKKQPETKVSQQMEQITMQLDLTPSVWEEGEEAAAEAGDGEKVQEAPGGGGDDVETSGSTKEAAGSEEGEQQQGKTKQTAGADVAEQQLGNEEALLILPNGYDPDEEDEPAFCFLAPAPEEPASMEEALAGADREKWLVSRDAEYQSLLENGTWDLVVLPEGKKAVQCKWVLRIKTDDKGQVTIYKSRLVAKGTSWWPNGRRGNLAEKKKERTAGQFFHIGEQGDQGDASAKVGAELHPLDYWVLDTGAAWTMTPRKELLDHVRAAPVNEVCSASGHALKVAGAGRAAFKGADGKPVVLHDVLLVPDLKANLISLRKLAKAGVSTSTDGARTYNGQLGNRVLWDLHESKDVYRSIVTGRSKKPLELVHMDLVGPLPVQGHKGERYFLTIVDDWSRLMWAYPLKQKGPRRPTIKEDWLPFVEKQAECVMKRIRTDRGVAHVPKKYRSKLGASAIWCVHFGLAAESKGWLLWEPSKGVLFDSRDVKFVEGRMYGGWKKQPETKVSHPMEQITMQLDLTPSVWEEGEEAAVEGGDGEKVQEAPAGGGDDVETSGSTKEAAGSEEEEQQQGKTKLTAGADVAEQQLGNEEALLILPHGYDPDEEDEPAYCFLAPAPEEPASMEEALAGPDREKWLVVLPEGKKAVQCKWVLRIKTDHKGQVIIYKCRLVAKGFMQKEKQDFNEIFAPTAKPPTLRVFLADAAVSGKSIIQMDISTAFLNGILEEDVYMTQPPGYEDGTGRVCKLKKSIYAAGTRSWQLF